MDSRGRWTIYKNHDTRTHRTRRAWAVLDGLRLPGILLVMIPGRLTQYPTQRSQKELMWDLRTRAVKLRQVAKLR